MNLHLKRAIYALERIYRSKLEVNKYIGCDIDYSDPQFSTSIETDNIIGIALPHNSVMLGFPGRTQGDYEAMDRVFIIQVNKLKFPIEVRSVFIVYKGHRYDVKKFEILEEIYYLVGCKATGEEPHE